MIRIAHIINPVSHLSPSSDLVVAQPVTFETMRRAQAFARTFNVDVGLWAVGFHDDTIPEGFASAGVLTRSVLDTGVFQRPKKLPLLKDILSALYEATDADYLIYTNVDIALMPYFYMTVARLIEDGCDGIVINRRTIPKDYTDVKQIELMYAELGEKHPGYDCFVFRRDVYRRYVLGNACIGANWIGRVLIANVMAHAKRFRLVEEMHLTFHIGDDREWKQDLFLDYEQHNERELVGTLHKIAHGHQVLEGFLKVHQNRINTFSHQSVGSECELYGTVEGEVLRCDPVFIVGYPRSGTTLIQALMATQEGVVTLPETHFFNWVAHGLSVDAFGIITLDEAHTVTRRIRERIALSIQAERYIGHLMYERRLTLRFLFEIVIIDNALRYYDLETIKRSIWIEKTPDHALFLVQIAKLYPAARVINVLRDPQKAITSRREHFAAERLWPMRRHIDMWLKSLEGYERFAAEHPQHSMLLRYEDAVAEPTRMIASACRFVDIVFQASSLDHSREAGAKCSYSWESWKQDVIHQGVSIDIANQRGSGLDQQERRELVEILMPYLEKYGYIIEK